MKVLSSIERLDLAAWVQSKAGLISFLRVALFILAALCFLVAIESKASSYETWLVWCMAAASGVAALLLWIDWRYRIYPLALLCFVFAALFARSHDHPEAHTIFGWIAGHFYIFICVYWGCALVVIAYRYATVNGSGWEKERSQVDDWLGMLKNQRNEDIIGFDWGNFWRGYWTYRILKRADCWMIAQFKKGTDKLVSCRVCELSEVAFTKLPSGKWKIDIMERKKKKSFTEIDIPPPLPPAFETFVRPATA